MRMWLIPAHLLCRQHLLGEHRELHALWRSIELGKYGHIHGHSTRSQIDVSQIISRHDELVREMDRRGYDHKSPLPDYVVDVIQKFIDTFGITQVDSDVSLKSLAGRCETCKGLQIKYGYYIGEIYDKRK